MTPIVLNKNWQKETDNCVYIGRPGPWGNPFSHKPETVARWKVNTRDEAVDFFEKLLEAKIKKTPGFLQNLIDELGGKSLICWCAPARCHGDVLIKYANPDIVFPDPLPWKRKKNEKLP